MKKIILLLMIFTLSLFGVNITKPIAKLEASGGAIDLVINDGKLYVATDASAVDIFDIKTKKKIKTIKVSQIKDFMGDTIDSKVYSVDVIDGKILIHSQDESGFRRIDIYENGKLNHIITTDDMLYIAKAKFLDKDTLIFGLLGNDIISYNLKNKKNNWVTQASQSKFSNLILSKDKKEVVICDESGDLKIIDTKTGKIKKILKGQNLDNVFQADYKNNMIITAGQDRRSVVYNLKTGGAYYKSTNFLIYSAGLSPSGKKAGYACDELNNVEVFNTLTKSKIALLGENKMNITNIVFLDENHLFVASEDKTINFYKIK